MVKISGKTDYSRFARPTSEDEGDEPARVVCIDSPPRPQP
jgi:hypothetical protein